jgi:hypothetical protein
VFLTKFVVTRLLLELLLLLLLLLLRLVELLQLGVGEGKDVEERGGVDMVLHIVIGVPDEFILHRECLWGWVVKIHELQRRRHTLLKALVEDVSVGVDDIVEFDKVVNCLLFEVRGEGCGVGVIGRGLDESLPGL